MEMTINLFKANHKTTNLGHLISDGFKLAGVSGKHREKLAN